MGHSKNDAHVLSLKIRLPVDDDGIFHATVGTADFAIQEPSNPVTWHSHKIRSAAVKCELALDMDGDIAWIKGPFCGGTNDQLIFREGLGREVPDGKVIIADKGHRPGSSVAVPHEMDTMELRDLKKRALDRLEILCERFRGFDVLLRVFPDSVESHRVHFSAIVAVTQLTFEQGEPLPSLWDSLHVGCRALRTAHAKHLGVG